MQQEGVKVCPRVNMHCREVDEPGFVPLGKTGAELLFEPISQRCERGSPRITSNPAFEE